MAKVSKQKPIFKELVAKIIKQLFKHRGEQIYERFWNPINYAIIGGIGVLINYMVWSAFVNVYDWWFTNALAIISAWLWNWSMSVGPFGYLWGFTQQKEVMKLK